MENLRREIDPVEQEVLKTLSEELALARAALRDPDAPMWQYAIEGGLNSPKLIEIREIDDQLGTLEDS